MKSELEWVRPLSLAGASQYLAFIINSPRGGALKTCAHAVAGSDFGDGRQRGGLGARSLRITASSVASIKSPNARICPWFPPRKHINDPIEVVGHPRVSAVRSALICPLQRQSAVRTRKMQ